MSEDGWEVAVPAGWVRKESEAPGAQAARRVVVWHAPGARPRLEALGSPLPAWKRWLQSHSF